MKGDESGTTRRAVLAALAGVPVVSWAARAEAREYTSVADVFDEIGRREVEVEVRLDAIVARVPAAAPFAKSVRATHARHGTERRELEVRLRVKTPRPSAPALGRDALDLEALRSAAQALVHAHAEGLPALDDAEAVDTLARHMVDVQRLLTVIELWVEAESARG